jgi:hypothetical protein
MIIVSNERMIRRNSRIAQYTGLVGLFVLLAGVYFFFTQPENFPLIWATVLIGFVLSQIGIYFTNRWGRRPRPDEHLNSALKGLEASYSIYHYATAVPHMLVGPSGVWVLLPRYQKGRVTYGKGRWRQSGGGFFQSYMRIFGQEGLGRPDLEIQSDLETARRYLAKKMPDQELPPIQAALVFTNEGAQVEAEGAPTLTVPLKKLREEIRKAAKANKLPAEEVKEIQRTIEAGMPPGINGVEKTRNKTKA